MQPERAACGRSFDEELLSGYMDGVLWGREARRVRLHLETCDRCASLYHQMTLLRGAVRLALRFSLAPQRGLER